MKNVGAERHLQRVVLGQRRCSGRRRKEQVTAFAQADVGAVAIYLEDVTDGAQECDAVKRNLDVHCRRELLADRACRKRGRRGPEGRVFLDKKNAPAETRRHQMIGERSAVDRATDDHDVMGHAAASRLGNTAAPRPLLTSARR